MKLKKKLMIGFGIFFVILVILVITHIPQPEPVTFLKVVTSTVMRQPNS